MLSPVDTRILTARPDHLRPLTEADRAARDMLATERQNRLGSALAAVSRLLARKIRPATP